MDRFGPDRVQSRLAVQHPLGVARSRVTDLWQRRWVAAGEEGTTSRSRVTPKRRRTASQPTSKVAGNRAVRPRSSAQMPGGPKPHLSIPVTQIVPKPTRLSLRALTHDFLRRPIYRQGAGLPLVVNAFRYLAPENADYQRPLSS